MFIFRSVHLCSAWLDHLLGRSTDLVTERLANHLLTGCFFCLALGMGATLSNEHGACSLKHVNRILFERGDWLVTPV